MTPRIRILIVDDEAAIRFAISEYFDAYGFVVDGAADLCGANRLLAGTAYDAVIADLRLSDGDDTEGLQAIVSACHCRPRPRIVLLTAHISPSVEQSARQTGADAVLEKPMPLWALKDLLVTLIDTRPALSPAMPRTPTHAGATITTMQDQCQLRHGNEV